MSTDKSLPGTFIRIKEENSSPFFDSHKPIKFDLEVRNDEGLNKLVGHYEGLRAFRYFIFKEECGNSFEFILEDWKRDILAEFLFRLNNGVKNGNRN